MAIRSPLNWCDSSAVRRRTARPDAALFTGFPRLRHCLGALSGESDALDQLGRLSYFPIRTIVRRGPHWIKRGFHDGVFLLVGNLQPNLGGGIVAHNTSLSDLQTRVNDDPFVAENVVSAEILQISPSRADERLGFLLG